MNAPASPNRGAPTPQALWQWLVDHGHAQGAMPLQPVLPWYLKLMNGAAGWLASWLIIGFLVGTVLAAARSSPLALGLTGAALMAAARALLRRALPGTARQGTAMGVALQQSALATGLAGVGLAVAALWAWRDQAALAWSALHAATVVLACASALAVPQAAFRTLCFIGAWVALTATVLSLGYDTGHDLWLRIGAVTQMLALAAAGVAAALAWHEDALLARGHGPLARSLATASLAFVVAAALTVQAFDVPQWRGQLPVDARFASADTWLSVLRRPWLGHVLALALAAVWAWPARWLAGTGTVPPATTRRIALALLALGLLLGSATGVWAGLAVAALGLHRASRAQVGVGLAVAVLGFGVFYYALHWTLMVKSLVLMAAGVALLLPQARAALGRGGRA